MALNPFGGGYAKTKLSKRKGMTKNIFELHLKRI